MGKYCCAICEKVSNQKSHHEAHLESELHVTKVENFKLKMQHRSIYDIIKEYPKYLSDIPDDINEEVAAKCKFDLIEKLVVHKTTQIMENTKQSTGCQKYKRTNTLVSELTEEELNIKKEEDKFKCVFIKFLDKCHNTLRSNQSVMGTDALDDIIYTFLIVYLSNKVTCDEGVYNFGNIEKSYYRPHEKKKVKEYLPYLNVEHLLDNVAELRIPDKLDAIQKIGYILSKHPSTKNIIKNDNFINSKNANSYAKLLKEIRDFSNEYNIFKHTDIIGRAYEHFVNDRGSGDDDTQHFTERPLMNMSFKLIDKEDIIELGIDDNSTIGDEFCGTFGYPINLKTYLKDTYDININDKKIYGVEQHDRLSRYAKINAMLSLTNSKNVTQGDSFITNVTPHLDIGIFNVPFGKASNYIEKDELYELSDELPDFKSVCKCKGPLAVTSSQLAFYKVKKMGLCIIKDGVETSSASMKAYRKHLCDNYVIKKIMKIPQGMFASTGTATVCIYFIKKEGKSTENIQFLQLNKECSQLHEICKINLNDLKQNNYSWDPNAYLVDEKMKELMETSKCEFKMLKDVGDIQNGERVTKKKEHNENNEYYVYGGGEKTDTFKINRYNRERSCKISRFGASSKNCVSIIDEKYFLNDSGFTILSKDNVILINDYLWYYLYYNLINNLEVFPKYWKGGGQKNIDIEEFKKHMIPTPKIEIQTKCVKQLNDLSNQKEMINYMKDGIKRQMKYFIDSQIQKSVNENNIEVKTIKEIFNNINQGVALTKKNMIKGKYNVIGGGKIIDTHNSFNREGGEIIITRVGDININYFDDKYFLTENGFSLKTENSIMNKYIYYILNTDKEKYLRESYIGGGQKVISKGRLEIINIPIVNNYEEITQKMNELSDKIKNLENDIIFIDNLMKEIMKSTYQ
jgi:restriction endonuclease S subunit